MALLQTDTCSRMLKGLTVYLGRNAMAQIHSICWQKTASEHVEPYRFSREPIQNASLREGHGIEGDKKAGHNPDRQLNIMSFETLEGLATEGFRTTPGEMGEQIVVSGLDINGLEAGTQVQFGNEAVIEIVKPRTGCEWFELVQGKSPKVAAGRMGMMAKVVKSGAIKVGDSIKVLETVQP